MSVVPLLLGLFAAVRGCLAMIKGSSLDELQQCVQVLGVPLVPLDLVAHHLLSLQIQSDISRGKTGGQQ